VGPSENRHDAPAVASEIAALQLPLGMTTEPFLSGEEQKARANRGRRSGRTIARMTS
jgi:hypothetical protein